MIATNLADTIMKGPAYIASDYNTTCFHAFTLNKFYFACSTNVAGPADLVPTPCVATITGYLQGVQVAAQEFDYDPAQSGANMNRADPQVNLRLPGFYRVDKVEFTTQEQLNTVLLLDDLKYNLHVC